ncbi:MAG: 3'-5' exonuclease [Synechococcaceae cyanobacterium]|nr:3'-5' exonuclease [Synechococcaceae cyanobacterium]
MTYTKADGTTSLRDLTIYSRNLTNGETHSLNCRERGEQITKKFLLSGISRLELPGLNPVLVLSNTEEIAAWLERHIPGKPPSPSQTRPSILPAPAAGAPEPPRTQGSGALSPFLPPPPPPPPPPAAQPPQVPSEGAPKPDLPRLLPDGARGFAVLDLETTGTGRSCRIVEIALVRLDSQGRITEEWETLVHPGIPIPNAHIHGIDDVLVSQAPSFAGIAGTLAAKLHEHVLVAHNLRGFDGPILEAHFAEVDGIDLSLGSGVDTMPRPRVKLVDLCAQHGVELKPEVSHTALGDTRALTKALQSGMAHLEPAGSAVAVARNGLQGQPARTLTRSMAAAPGARSGWMSVSIPLEAGQAFITTGPPSTKPDTEIKRAEAHGIRLGLQYRKVNAIPKRNPPAFLLATSLQLANRKMAEARELQIPVVLCRDFMQARSGSSVQGWRYQS